MITSTDEFSYPVIIKKVDELYTVCFPDFNASGKGYEDYEETLSFASDMLGEMILAYKEKNLKLPEQKYKMPQEEDSGLVMVSVNYRDYKDTADRNKNRIIYKRTEPKKAVQREPHNAQNKSKGSITKNRKLIVIAGIIILALIAFSAIYSSIEEKREQARQEAAIEYADQCISDARQDIKDGRYAEAMDTVESFDDPDLEYGYREDERETLYTYAKLLEMRSNDPESSLEEQLEIANEVSFNSSDEFYKESEELKATIENEKTVKEMKEALKKSADERKRREKLSADVPYEGMAEEDLSSTSVGCYSVKSINLYYDCPQNDEFDVLYEWDAEPSETYTFPLKVGTKDGKVTWIEKDYDLWAWDDGKPTQKLLERMIESREYPDDTNDKFDVFSFFTAKEFADSKQDAFIDSVIKEYKDKGIYEEDGLDREDFNDIAWNRAFDYWIEKQYFRESDQEAEHDEYMDAVLNSKN